MAKKETTKKENIKNKKSFFKDFKAELKRVIWPTKKQLVNNTVAVITIVLITGIIVLALDFVFENINQVVVNQVRNVYTSIEDSNETNPENKDQNNQGNEGQQENIQQENKNN